MTSEISAETLREWLYDGNELALLDVREPGQTILGHILFSAPLPFSRFEVGLAALAPNPSVRMVLCDDGDGIAERAAKRASAMGYENISCLSGGVASWLNAGHALYQGVNVPSKAFGELVEHAADTPRLPCARIAEMQSAGADLVIVDGRPLEEFSKMSIPGAGCCPNGELALRASSFAPDPNTTIIVNCAGRTRSIIGAQTLIDMGVPNPVFAMENGTQGWVLDGLTLDEGKQGNLPTIPEMSQAQLINAEALATKHGVETVSAGTISGWLSDVGRTVFLLDVRTSEERASDPVERQTSIQTHSVVHAPGGQLVQATDQWIGVRNADIVVLDTENVRAPVTAAWLRRLGHRAVLLRGGLDGLSSVAAGTKHTSWQPHDLETISPEALRAILDTDAAHLIDLRSSAEYRNGHIAGAAWSTRSRVSVSGTDRNVVLIAHDPHTAAIVVSDLKEVGIHRVHLLSGRMADWRAADLPIEQTPDLPTDAERIDFQSFTAGRHDGDEAASRQYLKWEIELVDQLDAEERAVFSI